MKNTQNSKKVRVTRRDYKNTFFIDVEIISEKEKKKFEKSLKLTENALAA